MINQPFLIFSIGTQRYAVSIDDVIEVASMVELTNMPTKHPEVIGLANRHGVPLPMLDVRRVFGQNKPVITASTLFIVAESNDDKIVALVVDEIHQVEYVPIEQLNVSSGAGKFIRGIINSNNILTQVLDINTLFQAYFSEAIVDEDMFKV